MDSVRKDDEDRIGRILEGIVALGAAVGRLEGYLSREGGPLPPSDPSAVLAAEEMVRERRLEILKEAGLENGDYEE